MKHRLNSALSILTLALLFCSNLYAKNILVIGDSHSCGSFGESLAKNLTSSGDTIDLFCAVSSSPYNWVRGVTPPRQECKRWTAKTGYQQCFGTGKVPTLESILSAGNYENVIVALGTNSLGSGQVDSSYGGMIKTISAKIKSCVWVGPPHLQPSQAKGFSPKSLELQESNLDSFYKSLTKTVSPPCKLIDSRPMTASNTSGGATSDGVHRSKASGVNWAKGIVVVVQSQNNSVSESGGSTSEHHFTK